MNKIFKRNKTTKDAKCEVTKKKHKGFDGIIVVIGLILLVMLLIFAIKTFLIPKLQDSIKNTGEEIEQINDWGDTTNNNNNGNNGN